MVIEATNDARNIGGMFVNMARMAELVRKVATRFI